MGIPRSTAKGFRCIAFAAYCTAMWAACGAVAKAEPILQEAANVSGKKTNEADTPPANSVTAGKILYIPPFRGAPTRRIGGATRSEKSGVEYLAVIAPIESGVTMRSMPNFYWYLTKGTEAPVEITVIHPDESEPRIEIRLPGPVSSGMHRLSLSELGIEIKNGVEYEWHVAVIPDNSERSADIVSSSIVKRVHPSPELINRIAGKHGLEKAKILAAEGIWYDAIDVLVSKLEDSGDDPELRQSLAALLSQVGLDRVADDY